MARPRPKKHSQAQANAANMDLEASNLHSGEIVREPINMVYANNLRSIQPPRPVNAIISSFKASLRPIPNQTHGRL
jgi:hypothetical protein